MLITDKIKVFENFVDTLKEFNDVIPTVNDDEELNCPPNKKKKKKVLLKIIGFILSFLT